MPVGIDYELKTIDNVELGKDRCQMVPDGSFGDIQVGGNLPVLKSLSNQGNDLTLAWGEGGDLDSFRGDRLDKPSPSHLP